jgi:tRNA-dihydrouridine synthase
VGNPWIFREARALLSGDEAPEPPSRAEVVGVAIEHLQRSVARNGPRGLLEMRKTLVRYLRGFPHVNRIRPRLFAENDARRVIELLEDYRRSLGRGSEEPAALHAGEPS